MSCQFEIPLNEDDWEGLNWLNETLDSIRKKGKKHKSYHKALACTRALKKIRDHCHSLHGAIHVIEERAECLVHMVVQPWGEA